jgi:hypothetical protein
LIKGTSLWKSFSESVRKKNNLAGENSPEKTACGVQAITTFQIALISVREALKLCECDIQGGSISFFLKGGRTLNPLNG